MRINPINTDNKRRHLFFFIIPILMYCVFAAPKNGFGLKSEAAAALNKPAEPSKINITADSLVVNNKSKH